MEEMSKHGSIGQASMKAGMDRKTGRKYVAAGALPSEMAKARDWRTREDAFSTHWPEVEVLLRESPALEAKTVFEMLVEKHPGRFEEGQLRTLQRRVKTWCAEQGPDKDVVLAQRHRPGEAGQTDFTWAAELAVTIAGQLFVHMLCVFVLPYSNWRWATVCLSESMAALRRGVQRALFQLGRVPEYHQTDNSTAATHRIPDGKSAFAEGAKCPFNEQYLVCSFSQRQSDLLEGNGRCSHFRTSNKSQRRPALCTVRRRSRTRRAPATWSTYTPRRALPGRSRLTPIWRAGEPFAGQRHDDAQATSTG
jgi:hypothetical protein